MSDEQGNQRRYFPPVFDFAQLFTAVRDWRAADARWRDTGSNSRTERELAVKNVWRARREVRQFSGFPSQARILITGEAGVGKTTFALALIRAMMVDWEPEWVTIDSRGVPWSPVKQLQKQTTHYLYYLSTEVNRKRLQYVFGQYGWFKDGTEGDSVFTPKRVFIPQIPVGSLRLPMQGAHELVDLVVAQFKAHIADAPQSPTFIVVDSLTAILKDSRDAGERRREALEFMYRIEDAMGERRRAPMFLISERSLKHDPVAHAEEIATDFVFHLGHRQTSSSRSLRTLTITKSAGVDMSTGEHTWAVVAQESGLDRVIAERNVVRKWVGEQGGNTTIGTGRWTTVCVFPRPQLPPIGKRNEELPEKKDPTTGAITNVSSKKPKKAFTGIPGLDELLHSKVFSTYWIQSAIDPNWRVEPSMSLLEGTTTLLMGTAGTGKTTACLQFLNASDPIQSLYVNFEQPVSLIRKFFPDALLTNLHSIYRRRGNLDINVLLAEVRHVITKKQIGRIAIDGLSDLLATTDQDDYARLVEQLLGTIHDAGRDLVTTFITFELEAKQVIAGRLAIEGLSAAADNVVVFRQIAINDEFRKTAHVLKARGMSPDRQVRELVMTSDSKYPLRIVNGLESYSGLLSGKPKPVKVVLQLFAENKAELQFNLRLKRRLQKVFKYPIEMFGFSRSAMNRTLEDFTSPTSRVPPTDIKVLSLDEWWIREFGTLKKEEVRLLPLDPFFMPREKVSPSGDPPYMPSLQQFWFFEIEKASIVLPDEKEKPKDKQTYQAHLLGIPNYTDFGLFCFNPEVARKCSLYYQSLAAKGPAKDAKDNAWRAEVMDDLALSEWPHTLGLIPRTWVSRGHKPGDFFGFVGPCTTEPASGRPLYLVDILKIASDAGHVGFCFDSETVETAVCTFIEFCWNFGAREDFLKTGFPDKDRVEEAVRFLQYLVYHGLTEIKPKLKDTGRALFSRQWYSTLSEVIAGQMGLFHPVSGLVALPFFPLGAVENRDAALKAAYLDECDRLVRLARRIRAAIIYRAERPYPREVHEHIQEARLLDLQIRKLTRSHNIGRPDLDSLHSKGEAIHDLAMNSPQLSRGARADRDHATQRLEGENKEELRKNLPVARSINIRDILELLRWHKFRIRLMYAELNGGTIPEAILDDQIDGNRNWTGAPSASLSALTGYCCSGSWMVGTGMQTHSPHLSWKLIEEMTSLEQSVRRAKSGAGIPVRKDFYDGYGKYPVKNIPHLNWNELLRFGTSRCRGRHRIVTDQTRLKDKFQTLYIGLMDCLTVAGAARGPRDVDTAVEHASRTIGKLFS
jgi:KaiC/GvpD/RAD55 family RecA-like ATPase